MQLLKIKESTTLSDLSDVVGEANLDNVLALNSLSRERQIGKQFKQVCNNTIENSSDTTIEQKLNILNTLTKDSDVFEEVALGTEEDWKVINGLKTLPSRLRMPDAVQLPYSSDVLGNDVTIQHAIYKKVIKSVKSTGQVDPSIFNKYDASTAVKGDVNKQASSGNVFQYFHIPWGQVVLYSSLEGESKDFPVYPEELIDGRAANYTQMPDILYQYEPWQVYQSSGPRTGSYTFSFHRDMWTGDHTDGLANELIRFCEANCYPEYKGSAVNVPIVSLYIAGKNFITGVLTSVNTHWYGPIGHDGWYLACDLEISITEVSPDKLDYATVKDKSIIG